MANHFITATFIWNTTDLTRDKFKRVYYKGVIFPFTVLRKLDQVLESTKETFEKHGKH